MGLIALNENGLRIGESHANARLSDWQVEMIRTLHADGLSYSQLAKRFDQSKGAIAKICRYERRNQIPVDWKKA